jgi:pyruvate/2-oxoglutarate dehydrogenase complex dihydrolipoamide acyltransferase (E2) component
MVTRLAQEHATTNLSEIIADNFGANATYVEGLLARWQSDPALVDESWRAYFEELVGPNGADGDRATATPVAAAPKETPATDGNAAAAAPAKEKPKPPAAKAAASLEGEALPIRGPALKIVENMQASLAVPTATSQRRIPVRLLDENRRLINRHLEEAGRGKASYTHLIAFALLRALEEFPQMNDGFDVIEEQSVRV